MIVLAPVVLALVYFQRYISAVIAAFIMVGLTRIPDWDMHLALIRHRGITHTLTFAAFMGILTGIALAGLAHGMEDALTDLIRDMPDALKPFIPTPSVVQAFGFGTIIGFLSIVAHLFGDIITPTGIRPLLPFSDTRYRYPVTYASDPLSNIMLFLAGFGLVIAAFIFGLILNGTLSSA